MKNSKINDWLTLVVNIDVVGGIIFLAIEIRQNNELLRSKSRQTLVANDVTSLTANIENADVFAKLVSAGELSAEDQLRLSFMYTLDLRNREFEYMQYVNGLLDEETWLSYRHVILVNHSKGRGRVWWNEIGRGIVDPEFAKVVDEVLGSSQPDDTYERMATCQANWYSSSSVARSVWINSAFLALWLETPTAHHRRITCRLIMNPASPTTDSKSTTAGIVG